MRTILMFIAVVTTAPAAWAYVGIDDCNGIARNGARLIRAGDSTARVRDIFGTPHHVTRLRKTRSTPAGRTWVYEFTGHNPREVRFGVSNGRVVQVCEHKG